MNLQQAAAALRQNGFAVRIFETGAQCADALSQELCGKTIGFGGSVTLRELGLYERLAARNQVFWHWKQDADAQARSAGAEVYLLSANAVSETGALVNIDGTGNRVASMLFGHAHVILIAGVNKLTPDRESAWQRAKHIAAPLNARRLSCRTPCALADPPRCHDCQSPDRICNASVILEKKPGGIEKFEVLLVNEPLGY